MHNSILMCFYQNYRPKRLIWVSVSIQVSIFGPRVTDVQHWCIVAAGAHTLVKIFLRRQHGLCSLVDIGSSFNSFCARRTSRHITTMDGFTDSLTVELPQRLPCYTRTANAYSGHANNNEGRHTDALGAVQRTNVVWSPRTEAVVAGVTRVSTEHLCTQQVNNKLSLICRHCVLYNSRRYA